MVDAFDLKHRAKGCVAYNPDAKLPTYGYVPTLSAGIIYTVVFAIITVLLTLRVIKSKKWWYLSLPIGALAETIGWAGRAAAHHCPYNSSLFSLQISILIIGMSDSIGGPDQAHRHHSTVFLLGRNLLYPR